MAIPDVSADCVLAAIAEFDSLGRDAFLARYGFEPTDTPAVVHKGQEYDGVALLAGAQSHIAAGYAPLRPAEVIGREADVVRHFRQLGFAVIER